MVEEAENLQKTLENPIFEKYWGGNFPTIPLLLSPEPPRLGNPHLLRRWVLKSLEQDIGIKCWGYKMFHMLQVKFGSHMCSKSFTKIAGIKYFEEYYELLKYKLMPISLMPFKAKILIFS